MNSLLERRELRNSKVLQEFASNCDLVKLYKYSVQLVLPKEPKKKSPMANLDDLINDTAPEDIMNNFKILSQKQKEVVGSIDPMKIEKFVTELDKYIEINVPTMSKMKYLAIDIASCYEKMSTSLFSLNEMMGQVLNSQRKLNQTIDLADKFKVDDLIGQLKDGLNGWGTWCLVNKRLINDHFVNYLHFRKHEMMALKELTVLRSYTQEQLRVAKLQLYQSKQKLFESRNFEKWGTKSSEFKEPIEQIIQNYQLADKYILPQETAKVNGLHSLATFIHNSVYFEYVQFNKRDQRRIVKNFNEYATKTRKSTQSPGNIWNIFDRLTVEHDNIIQQSLVGQNEDMLDLSEQQVDHIVKAGEHLESRKNILDESDEEDLDSLADDKGKQYETLGTPILDQRKLEHKED